MVRTLALWLIFGAFGLAVFLHFYPQAFPEAGIDFRINRNQALEIGEKALGQLGVQDLSGYIRSAEFNWHETAKRFLEKTMGLAKASEIMRREISVWYWSCVWKRPKERRWYMAAVNPDGRIIRARIFLPEEERGASLTERQARKIAEEFVQKNLQLKLSEWKLVTATQLKRPNRLDYTFVYEHEQKRFPPQAKNPATLRFDITVSGDKVTGYTLHYLRVPEWWRFEERRKQTARMVLLTLSTVAYILMLLAFLFLGLRSIAQKESIAWETVLTFPILVFALHFAVSLNYAPLWWTDYDPAKPIGTFIGNRIVSTLFGSFLSMLPLLLATTTAEFLSRDRPPDGIPLGVIVRPAFWCTKEAFTAIVVGFCVGAMHLGYVTAFYLLGRKVGIWTPLSIPDINAVATPFPFLVPLFMGLKPALDEEMFFRFAAIYLLWRLTKRFWLSAILPNIVWAFMHVGYPSEPAFARGLELTLPALFYTWVVFRYGIVASIVAHYTYNAVLTSQIFLRAQEPSLWFSGLIASVGMLSLLLPSVITFLRHRQLPSASDLQPIAPTPIPQPAVVEVAYAPYQPISRTSWAILVALAAVSFIVNLIANLRQPPFKVVAVTEINRNEAKQLATEFLRRKGVNVGQYRVAVGFSKTINEDDHEAAYILEHADRETLYRLWLEHLPFAFWVVRFFRPLEREEWFVAIRPDGRLIGHWHRIPEEAKGLKLTKADAQKQVETYLRELGVDPLAWKLIEVDSYERPNRRDWSFTYEHKTFRVAEAKLRMSVSVQGDEAHGYNVWLQVPENWVFERERFEAWTDLAIFWLLILLLVSGFVVAFVDWREGAYGYNWRLGIKFALALTPLVLLEVLNGIPDWWIIYPTTMSLALFAAIMTLFVGIALLVIFLLLMALGGFDQWIKVRLPEIPPLSLWLSRHNDPVLAETPLRHPAAWRDAVLFGYIASFAFIGLFGDSEPNSRLIHSSFLPAINFLNLTVWTTLISLVLGILWAGFYRRYIGTPKRLFIVLLLLLPVGLIGSESPSEALRNLSKWAACLFVGAIILYWLGRYVLRGNLYAWALGIALPMLLAIAVELLQSPDAFIKAQALPLLLVYLLPAISLFRVGVPSLRLNGSGSAKAE